MTEKEFSVPLGTPCDKLTTKAGITDAERCLACGGSGIVLVADSDEVILEECIMCPNNEEKNNEAR